MLSIAARLIERRIMDRGKYRGLPVDSKGNIAQMVLPDNSAGNRPFVHGAMFKAQGKIYIIPHDATLEDVDGEWGLFGFIEVCPDTVGQYTGLKDKNGTEIYEGDMFEVVYTDTPDGFVVMGKERDVRIVTGVVVCKFTGFYVEHKHPLTNELRYTNLYNFLENPKEIIGTIHDKEKP